ncbi:MAG: TetR family transcriptional regulator C-terminal domain-containing protein [Myxococcales bacterium]|nr:TetR family transcriptional regulator C-terminal domain-containing protein [Myxococcales bacterium]
MPRPSNTAERRAEIVDGFLSVMSREGYERATILKAARAAGLSPGLVHYHFADKEAVLVALVEQLAAGLSSRVAARLAAAGDHPRRRVHAIVDALVAKDDDADPRAVAAWVVVGAEAVREPAVRAPYAAALAALFAQLETEIASLLRSEGKSPRRAKGIAAALLVAFEGAFQVSATAPGLLPDGFAAKALRRVVDALVESPS